MLWMYGFTCMAPYLTCVPNHCWSPSVSTTGQAKPKTLDWHPPCPQLWTHSDLSVILVSEPMSYFHLLCYLPAFRLTLLFLGIHDSKFKMLPHLMPDLSYDFSWTTKLPQFPCMIKDRPDQTDIDWSKLKLILVHHPLHIGLSPLQTSCCFMRPF